LTAILIIQAITFLALGALFLANGQPKLGIAQLLLAAVQGPVYS
jgi:hypothetical protein